MDQGLQLIELDTEYKKAFEEYKAELDNCGILKDLFEYDGEGFERFVEKLNKWKQGQDLPKGWVQTSTFFLLNEKNVIVGKCSMRHELNVFLKTLGGHIGYGIRPSQRKKGYGTAILRLVLEKARQIHIKRALVTCDETNIASTKIIEKNGGVLENIIPNEGTGIPKKRYWIEIK